MLVEKIIIAPKILFKKPGVTPICYVEQIWNLAM